MNIKNLFIAACGASILLVGCDEKKDTAQTTDSSVMATELDSVSYGLGVSVGTGLKAQGVTEINGELLSQALNDALAGEPKFDEFKANEVIRGYIEKAQSKKAEGAKEAGQKFLAENGQNPDVQTTASGLQYIILSEGTGQKPSAEDVVKVHYHGTLIDGTVFDSSVDRGEPAQFPVNGVIKGWVEALQMMPVGSKWKLFIPSDLAYGDNAAGPKIGPGSTLIFEVDLLEIVQPQ